MEKYVKKFKGGSLSSTNLISDSNGKLFVRKDISLEYDREYGFQRWYSQLKRLQRYSILFPDIFPKVLKFGKKDDRAYFDIEYIENSVNAHDFVENCRDDNELDKFFDELIRILTILHTKKIKSNPEAIELYISEEIDQRIKDCLSNNNFKKFIKYDKFYFNDHLVDSFLNSYDIYKDMLIDCYTAEYESFTHGNITLENIIYVPDQNRIILIDPYEENVIDSVLAEYSQLLQSTNSHYEIYNRTYATVKKNKISLEIIKPYGINYINNKLFDFIHEKHTKKEYFAIRLLEVSQFIRMLPFKMAVDENKMIFFYGLASLQFSNIKKEYQKLY